MNVQGPSVAWSKFERALAQVIGRFRTLEIEPLARRLDAIEQQQHFAERLAKLEARAPGSDAETKFERGQPLGANEWLTLCERIRAPLRLGVWAPPHSSWRAGR
jgi:hypothetical protein